VFVERGEGLIEEVGSAVLKGPAAIANAECLLRAWSKTAPKAGEGYEKCSFRVKFDIRGDSDESVYEGRWDLQRNEQIDLLDRMLGFLTHPRVYHAKNDRLIEAIRFLIAQG